MAERQSSIVEIAGSDGFDRCSDKRFVSSADFLIAIVLLAICGCSPSALTKRSVIPALEFTCRTIALRQFNGDYAAQQKQATSYEFSDQDLQVLGAHRVRVTGRNTYVDYFNLNSLDLKSIDGNYPLASGSPSCGIGGGWENESKLFGAGSATSAQCSLSGHCWEVL